ncbi:PorT family protein [Dysgonomonas sp. OttesenSCG-928-D17]|nr:PorT family protein [Dysgonomonas sp. OttesenSCG-928-D17]
MKKLFKTIFVTITLFIGINASAQDKPVTFGIKAGMNLSNMTKDLKGDAKIGFNAGVTLDFAMSPDVYLMSGLQYSLEGTKDGDAKMNFSYLKLPVHIGYKMPVSENVRFVLHIGPYLAYAVDGKYKLGSVSVDAFNKDLEDMFGFKYRRFDLGIGLGVGVEIGKIHLDLGYDLGFINRINMKDNTWSIDNTGISDPNGKNMNAYLTVGYKF